MFQSKLYLFSTCKGITAFSIFRSISITFSNLEKVYHWFEVYYEVWTSSARWAVRVYFNAFTEFFQYSTRSMSIAHARDENIYNVISFRHNFEFNEKKRGQDRKYVVLRSFSFFYYCISKLTLKWMRFKRSKLHSIIIMCLTFSNKRMFYLYTKSTAFEQL